MGALMTLCLAFAAVCEVLRARAEGVSWRDPSRQKVRILRAGHDVSVILSVHLFMCYAFFLFNYEARKHAGEAE